MRINIYEKIKSLFLFLFVLFCIIFPASDFIISKKVLFVINLGIVILDSSLYAKKIIKTSLLFRILIILGIVLVFSIPTFALYPTEVQFLIISCSTIFISFSAYDKKDEYYKYFMIATNILSMLTIFIALSSLYSKTLYNIVKTIFLDLNSGSLGKRKFGGLVLIMVHFRTAPLLIISSSYYFIKIIHNFKIRYLCFLFLQMLAIFFSASRGTMLFTVLSFISILCYDIRNKTSRRLLFCFLIIGYIVGNYLLTQTTMFSIKEKSNNIKIRHIESFNEFADYNPTVWLWGKGTGSIYYSKGFGKMTFQTEVTIIDMIRYFGVFFTILFIFAIIFPVKKSIMCIPFIMYFFDATTNPLIFCSTGMITISLYYLLPGTIELFSRKKNKRKLGLKNVLLHYNCSL